MSKVCSKETRTTPLVKHTQTIRRLLATNCLGVFDQWRHSGAYIVNL